MVTLDRILYKNYMNIKEQEVPLKDQGLVLVTGKNGAGKSSLFIEGPYYALYGKSFKYKGDKPGDNVVNDYIAEGEDSYVKLWLEVDGTEYVIVRSRRSKEYEPGVSVFSDGKDLSRGTGDETQEFINSLIGMGPAAFTHSVVFSTKILKFPTLKDSEKKEIFDEILQLEVLNVALEETKAALKKLKEKKKTLTDRLKFCKETIDRLEKGITESEAESALWESGRKGRIEALGDSIEEMGVSIAKLKGKKDDIQNKLSSAKASLEKKKSKYEKMRDLIDAEANEITKDSTRLESEHNSLVNAIFANKTERTKIENLIKNKKCPTCKGAVSRELLSSEINECERKLSGLTRELEANVSSGSDISDRREAVNEAKKQLSEFNNEVKGLGTLVNTLGDEFDIATETHNDAVLERSRNVAKLEAEKDALNPYSLKLDGLKKSLRDERIRLKESEEEHSAVITEIEEEEICEDVLGPKGARLYMIQAAIPMLNAEAAKVQSIMGTRLSVNFKLKSSEEAYGGNLVTEVFNPKGAKKYEGDSEGEQACVDWILLLSLLALVSSRGKKSFNQAFYDEVFDSLDEENEVGVLNVLKSIALTKSSVFMLSHSAIEIGGQCDRVWKVDEGKLIQEDA